MLHPSTEFRENRSGSFCVILVQEMNGGEWVGVFGRVLDPARESDRLQNLMGSKWGHVTPFHRVS